MPKRKGGSRRKTRGEFSRDANKRGKLSLRNYLAEYKPGDKVLLRPDSICMEGIFHARFLGKAGTVLSKRGSCYEVRIKDFNKEKTLIVHPVHMRRS